VVLTEPQGLYRLNSDDSWTAVTDSITTDSGWHNWGIDAVALDPQDANKVSTLPREVVK
jgi:xyloglucan-specific exo-beta-1,4-glucanase